MTETQLSSGSKSNLSALKSELKLVRTGHKLLDQKRRVLIFELTKIINEAIAYETHILKLLNKAYTQLREAIAEFGLANFHQLACSVNQVVSLQLSNRKVMGLSLPLIHPTVKAPDFHHYTSLDTPASVDLVYQKFNQIILEMSRFTEIKVSIIRLSSEIKRTIIRVNSLEKIVIPQKNKLIKLITNKLEENERDTFCLMKNFKKLRDESQLN